MHIDIIPNRTSKPTVLLRESYREGSKVKKRTLANLSSLPMEKVEMIRQVLRGDVQLLIPAHKSDRIASRVVVADTIKSLMAARKPGLGSTLAAACRRRASMDSEFKVR